MKRLFLFTVACVFSLVPLYAQEELVIDASNWADYLKVDDDKQYRLLVREDVESLRNVKKLTFAASIPSTYTNFTYNETVKSTVFANLEEFVLEEGHAFTNLVFWGTKLKKVTINNNNGTREFTQLSIQNALLTENDITLGSNVHLKNLSLHRNKLSSLEPIYAMAGSETFILNGGKYYRKQYAGVDDGTYNPTNEIREIDMTRVPTTIRSFQMNWHLLERIDFKNHPEINNIMIGNNLLWSLDLSPFTKPAGSGTNYVIGPQKPVADLTVVKGAAVDGSEDEVRLYLPEGQSELFDNSRLVEGSVKLSGAAVATQNILGTETEKYFKVASVADGTTADLNLYAKHKGFTYQYNTRPGVEDAALRDIDVEVKTYPYIMYINPATKSGKDVNYYSGTLWLDYDAIVPEGTTVWIVTDINKDSVTTGGTAQAASQLNLEKIGDPGDLIPAGTAMYVRSDNKAGLYDFQKAWKHEIVGWDGKDPTAHALDTLWYNKVYTPEQEAELAAQRTKIGNRNLLEGYPTETKFDNKYEALILGIESKKGTKMIGFWPFNGTTIPAHRAFISEDTYRRITGDANAKGATFFFNDSETTGIKTVDNEQKTISREGWYTLDGRRLADKPNQKGIYINNGRKEVIR